MGITGFRDVLKQWTVGSETHLGIVTISATIPTLFVTALSLLAQLGLVPLGALGLGNPKFLREHFAILLAGVALLFVVSVAVVLVMIVIAVVMMVALILLVTIAMRRRWWWRW